MARSLTGPQLDELLDQSQGLLGVQNGSGATFASKQDLQTTLTQLKQKHGVLKRKLIRARGTSNLRELIQYQMKEDQTELSDAQFSSITNKVLDRTITTNLDRTLGQIMVAHRLTGRSLFSVGNLVGIRFETFYRGQFHKSYYVLFDYKGPPQSKLVVWRHCIPYSIPLQLICDTFLNKSLRLFSDTLSEYLNAYTSRNQQFQALRSMIPLDQQFQCHDSLDFLQFTYHFKRRDYHFKLFYEDVNSCLPQRVTVHAIKEGQKQRWKKAETIFLKEDLDVAFEAIFSQ